SDISVPDARRQDVADAILRTGGWDGLREKIRGPVDVRPLTPALKGDYLKYFDEPAFADNPVWASCYCLSYHLDLAPEEFDARSAAENRAAREDQIERGDASGVLAFAGDRIVGWCNAAPRGSLPLLDRNPDFGSEDKEAS